jgi:hypothetical protein
MMPIQLASILMIIRYDGPRQSTLWLTPTIDLTEDMRMVCSRNPKKAKTYHSRYMSM